VCECGLHIPYFMGECVMWVCVEYVVFDGLVCVEYDVFDGLMCVCWICYV